MKSFIKYVTEGDSYDNAAFADRMERIKQGQIHGLKNDPVRPKSNDADGVDPEDDDIDPEYDDIEGDQDAEDDDIDYEDDNEEVEESVGTGAMAGGSDSPTNKTGDDVDMPKTGMGKPYRRKDDDEEDDDDDDEYEEDDED